jgi:NAD(P)-dependent dehydrogenase (short-subunit alcohol dehydrogenase family)
MAMKIAMVTGAGSGIGRSVAQRLVADGYHVILVGRDRSRLEETAAKASTSMSVMPCDVGDATAVEALFAAVEAKFGRLDLVFNNAGISAPAVSIDTLPVEDWMRVINTNLTGVFLIARGAFGLMRRQEPQGGRIINNGSVSAHAPRPNSIAYTASKHGVTGITRSISLDGRPYRIVCGQIDIGNAATDMAAQIARGVPQADGSIRAEPVFDAAHVADAVAYMAQLPLEANVQFITVMASSMPYIGRG